MIILVRSRSRRWNTRGICYPYGSSVFVSLVTAEIYFGEIKSEGREFGGTFFTSYHGLRLIGAEPEFHNRNSWRCDNHPEKVPPRTHSKEGLRMELCGRGSSFRAAKLDATSSCAPTRSGALRSGLRRWWELLSAPRAEYQTCYAFSDVSVSSAQAASLSRRRMNFCPMNSSRSSSLVTTITRRLAI